MIFPYVNDVFFKNGMNVMFSVWGYDNGVTPINTLIYECILLFFTGSICFLAYSNKKSAN